MSLINKYSDYIDWVYCQELDCVVLNEYVPKIYKRIMDGTLIIDQLFIENNVDKFNEAVALIKKLFIDAKNAINKQTDDCNCTIYKLYSEKLGKIVYIVPDIEIRRILRASDVKDVVYTVCEVESLIHVNVDMLKAIYNVKCVFVDCIIKDVVKQSN